MVMPSLLDIRKSTTKLVRDREPLPRRISMVLTDIPEVPAFKVILPAENRIGLPKRTYSTIKANHTEKVAKTNNRILSLIKLYTIILVKKEDHNLSYISADIYQTENLPSGGW